MKPFVAVCGWIVLAAGVSGCQPNRTPLPSEREADLTTSPGESAGPQVEFAPSGKGIRLAYPADWRAADQETFALAIAPAGAAGEVGAPAPPIISLDIPTLPPHIPGFIPLGMVVNGYVDDLRKQYPGVNAGKPEEMKVAGANARRVRSTWDADGVTFVEDAVLTVHGDRVYIFRANASVADEPRARGVLEEILESVRWE